MPSTGSGSGWGQEATGKDAIPGAELVYFLLPIPPGHLTGHSARVNYSLDSYHGIMSSKPVKKVRFHPNPKSHALTKLRRAERKPSVGTHRGSDSRSGGGRHYLPL